VTEKHAPVRLHEKLALFADHWHPRIVAQLDDVYAKVVKVQGEFVWHTHDQQDELFLVIEGELTIGLRDGDVRLAAGDLYVVPRGVEHCPFAETEASLLVLGREDTDQTGGVETELRAPDLEWI
jgi:mannose-6-phosphate isomerase-like protein (cupin superfamily)